MTHVFGPWVYALRRLALRAPEGPRTPPIPVPCPPGLEPPKAVPNAENGYLRLVQSIRDWPEEGMYPPDLVHWRKTLPGERKAAESALAPLRPYLEGVDAALNTPLWQAPIAPDGGFPELAQVKRLAQALHLRGSLDGHPADRERAVEIARRLRRSQGPLMHFLVALAIERQAEGPFVGVDEDRAAAVHWELARFAIPRAHLLGPWEPVGYVSPPPYTDARLATAWALSGHPHPYDPMATVQGFMDERDLMMAGRAVDLQTRVNALGPPWPPGMFAPDKFGPGHASLIDLWRARTALRDLKNPYGRLSVCHTLRVTAKLALAAEKARAA